VAGAGFFLIAPVEGVGTVLVGPMPIVPVVCEVALPVVPLPPDPIAALACEPGAAPAVGTVPSAAGKFDRRGSAARVVVVVVVVVLVSTVPLVMRPVATSAGVVRRSKAFMSASGAGESIACV
jgi:hypothetical protein